MVSVSESSPTKREYLSRMAMASFSRPLLMRKRTAATYSSDPLVSLSRSMRRAPSMPARSPASM